MVYPNFEALPPVTVFASRLEAMMVMVMVYLFHATQLASVVLPTRLHRHFLPKRPEQKVV